MYLATSIQHVLKNLKIFYMLFEHESKVFVESDINIKVCTHMQTDFFYNYSLNVISYIPGALEWTKIQGAMGPCDLPELQLRWLRLLLSKELGKVRYFSPGRLTDLYM